CAFPLVADCPSSVERSLVEKFTNCSTSCESDDDCVPERAVGYAVPHTVSVSDSNYHLVSTWHSQQNCKLRKVQRCDRGGKFERMQCDDNGCFCVDIDSGDEISGTRTTDSLPNC
ncbi:thyroglobulin type-1 repeat-containing domain protein, partial [Ostertagia ostertagi]